MREHNLQGVGIVVVNSDEILYQKGFGYSNVEQQKPIDAQSVFQVASISKLFTTTAIMQLDESAALAIDEPLTQYLPDFFIQTRPDLTSDVDDISLRHMLTHRSGLPSDYFHGNYQERPPSTEEYRAQFAVETLAQNPGDFVSYSNTGMATLAGVIESVGGQSFESFMQTHIFMPLSMNSSSFFINDLIRENLATPYRYNRDGSFTALNNTGSNSLAAGGLLSSTQDMANFMRSVLQDSRGHLEGTLPSLLTQETYQEIFKAQYTDNPIDGIRKITFGLGWNLKTLPITYSDSGAEDEALVVFHGGSRSGFNSQLKLAPGEDIAVFVATNTESGWYGSDAIADFVLESALEEFKGATITPEPEASNSATPIDWTPEQLNNYVGHYNKPSGPFSFSIYEEDQELYTVVANIRLRLQLMSDQSIGFHEAITDIQVPSMRAVMHEAEGHRIVYVEPSTLLFGLINIDGGFWLQFAAEPPTQAWLDRQGVYFFDGSEEAGAWNLLDPSIVYPRGDFCVNLSYDGELLILGELYGGSINYLGLIGYEDDRAYMPGVGRGGGEAVWIDELGRLNWRAYAMEFIPGASSCSSLIE